MEPLLRHRSVAVFVDVEAVRVAGRIAVGSVATAPGSITMTRISG
jgi:hypothetical protein